jgi:hypothetical protein
MLPTTVRDVVTVSLLGPRRPFRRCGKDWRRRPVDRQIRKSRSRGGQLSSGDEEFCAYR